MCIVVCIVVCIVIAAFIIYTQLKKRYGRRHPRRWSVLHLYSNTTGHYSAVPTDNPEVEEANNRIALKSGEFEPMIPTAPPITLMGPHLPLSSHLPLMGKVILNHR